MVRFGSWMSIIALSSSAAGPHKWQSGASFEPSPTLPLMWLGFCSPCGGERFLRLGRGGGLRACSRERLLNGGAELVPGRVELLQPLLLELLGHGDVIDALRIDCIEHLV